MAINYKAVDLMGWRVKNIDNFLFQDHPVYHPDSQQYYDYWINTQLRRCIEGMWVDDNGQWVWMYPKLYFYANIGTIIDLDEKNKSRIPIRPKIRDIEWIIFTYLYCCMGFSGFKDDPEFTCNEKVEEIEKDPSLRSDAGYMKSVPEYCFKEDGTLKQYVRAWDYLRSPKKSNLGQARYDNEAYDFFLLGARGLGKSYTMAVGDMLHEFITKGVKYWEDVSNISKNKIEIFVGSAQKNKAQEFLDKARYCMEILPGSYGTGEDKIPSPFYNNLSGSWNVGSKELEHSFKNTLGQTEGTKSKILHGVFTVENPEAGVGIRPVRIYNEETGLCSNVRDVYLANNNSLSIGGKKFGVGVYLGTSGSIEKIQQSRELMTRPREYRIYSIPNYWEGLGEIGLFVPSYYALNAYKDDNGNTDLDAAINDRLKFRKKLNPSRLEGEKMYMPLVPSEMFLTKKGNILPIAELEEHRLKLLSNPQYRRLGVVGEVIFDSDSTKGVKFKPDKTGTKQPIDSFPISSKTNTEGALVIYEHPIEEAGVTPNIYVIGHDPVKTDENGASFASIYVLKKPTKFTKFGGDQIVAEYIGRPDAGRHVTNEMLEKLAMYYGNHDRMIYFENAVGNVKEYFEKRKKLRLLATQPTTILSKKGKTVSRIPIYGYPMSSRVVKEESLSYLRDWLLKERGEGPDGRVLRNLDLLPSLYLVEQMIAFDFDGNFDGVMGFCGCIIGIEETYNRYKEEREEQKEAEGVVAFLNKSLRNKQKNKLNRV